MARPSLRQDARRGAPRPRDQPGVPEEHGALDPGRLRDASRAGRRGHPAAAGSGRAPRGMRDVLARRDAHQSAAHDRDRLGHLRRARALRGRRGHLPAHDADDDGAGGARRTRHLRRAEEDREDRLHEGRRPRARARRAHGHRLPRGQRPRHREARPARVLRVRLLLQGAAGLRQGTRLRRRSAAGAARVEAAPRLRLAHGRRAVAARIALRPGCGPAGAGCARRYDEGTTEQRPRAPACPATSCCRTCTALRRGRAGRPGHGPAGA